VAADPPAEPMGSAYSADPYPTLRRLREADPVHWSAPLGRWVLTRYDDAVAVLHDVRRFSSSVVPQVPERDRRPDLDDFARLSARWLFFLDPPRHRPERAPIAPRFTPRAVEALRASIAGAADRLLDRASPAGGMDLVADYAFPLASGTLAGLLCADPGDRDELLGRLLATEAASLSPHDPSARARGLEAIAAITASFRRLLHEAGPRPLSSLLHHLLAASGDATGACAHASLLLFAGVETTQNLIGNAALGLLGRPDLMATLRSEPGLIGAAIEECLRRDPPVLGVVRRVREDVPLRGRLLREGEEVLVMLAAANRDPSRFPDPDALDLRRPENPHLTFGLGIHYCLGASLARLEAQVALAALLWRFPGLRLASDSVEWRDYDPLVRGVKRLPVAF
jgi:cytochrome P450